MKVSVTALKAPWPDGTKAGDVVELGCDELPAWAIGKCVPAPEQPVEQVEPAPEQPVEPKAKGKK